MHSARFSSRIQAAAPRCTWTMLLYFSIDQLKSNQFHRFIAQEFELCDALEAKLAHYRCIRISVVTFFTAIYRLMHFLSHIYAAIGQHKKYTTGPMLVFLLEPSASSKFVTCVKLSIPDFV